MRYFKFMAENGYAGCDGEEYVAIPDGVATNEFLDIYADEFAREYEDMYEYIVTDSLNEEDYDSEEDYEADYEAELDAYWDNVLGSYEEVTEEEWEENGGRNL